MEVVVVAVAVEAGWDQGLLQAPQDLDLRCGR